MPARSALERLRVRPRADQWRDDELITLAEAVALFFADGPFNVRGLRTAIARGELAATMVCNRLYTSPLEIRRMTVI